VRFVVYLSVCCIPDISLQCDIRLFSLSLSHHCDQSTYLQLILFPPLLHSPSSIVDGRYNEQKHRLQECGLRSCLYIVEGLSLTGEHSNSHSQSDLTSPHTCLSPVTSVFRPIILPSFFSFLVTADNLFYFLCMSYALFWGLTYLFFSPILFFLRYPLSFLFSFSCVHFLSISMISSSFQARVCV
jgi:ERCC4 domain